MSDVFQRTGRGGAGNYYSQKDLEEAEKAARANDLEAQKTNSPPPPPEASSSPPPPASAPTPQYVRVGRGGAGNWTEPPTIADAQDRQNHSDHTTAAVSATGAGKPRTGLIGRGGAGNWTGGDYYNNTTEDPEQEKAEQQRIADRIKQDIDASLPAPPKTYHQHDRDMEK
ncbi:hypothetical protein VMCG_07120 [Cytospora schulzeri]|uniref:Uncharacterized protein n=1 Tax=Cytospora schulzeri TaxID=448051 RepID=A0A423W560_9PEZI|nr:hypothetical protein VMCG_07120 [Valsa malicola]